MLFSAFCLLLALPAISAINCRSGYSKRDAARCYKVYTTEVTQASAIVTCTSDNATLAPINDIDDNDFYADKISNLPKGAWIGPQLEDRPFPSWRNVNVETPIADQGCFNYTSSRTDFVDVDTSASFRSSDMTRELCLDYCETNGFAYAALNARDNCMCGYANISKDTPFTYPRERFGCNQQCAGDPSENCGGYGFTNVIFVTGTGFDAWALGEPNNEGEYATCATIDVFHSKKLNDYECHREFYYACQVGTTYTLVQQNKNWFDARLDCINTYGGDLATIPDRATWLSVFGSLAGRHYYHIGLASYLWRQPDGSQTLYTNWAPGEPNSLTSRCAYLSGTGLWNDDRCDNVDSTRGFICESTEGVEVSTTVATTTTETATTATATTATVTTTTRAPSPTTTVSTFTPVPPTTASTRSSTAATTPATPAPTPATPAPTPATPALTSATPAPTPATPAPTPAAPTPAAPTPAAPTSAAPTPAVPTPAAPTPVAPTPAAPAPTPATPAPPRATPAPTSATNTTAAAVAQTTLGGGNAGGSTGDSLTLSLLDIILIAICALFVIIIIIMIVVLCYYKRKNNRKNKITPGLYDGRPVAPIPYSGAIGDEVYLPASDASSTDSNTNLIKEKQKSEERSRAS